MQGFTLIFHIEADFFLKGRLRFHDFFFAFNITEQNLNNAHVISRILLESSSFRLKIFMKSHVDKSENVSSKITS